MALRKKIVIIICSIFFCAILLELGLRLGGFTFLSIQECRNRFALRQKGTYRIICLGESTTALGGENSYPIQLESILNQRKLGIKFSVINKGIPATNTRVILSQLPHHLDQYNPDMVITMMGLNDGKEFVFYEDISAPKFKTFFTSFRTCKLAKLLWLDIVNKTKGIDLTEQEVGGELENGLFGQTNAMQSEDMTPQDIGIDVEPALKNSKKYLGLGWYYAEQGKFSQAEAMFKKVTELNPEYYAGYAGLGYAYLELRKFAQMEESLKKAIELDFCNEDMGSYYMLADLYVREMKYEQAEEMLKKAIKLKPENYNGYVKLGWCYKKQGKFSQAEEMFKKAIDLEPRNSKVYGGLAVIYREMGRDKSASEYYEKANKLRLEGFNPVTRHNYLKLKQILDKRNIKLVCVQYPVRSAEPLKKIFRGYEGVIFVDNEKVFKDALKKASYREYFRDMMGGDFGHCTPEGNKLLAENIAKVILKECFNFRF